jgi:hypothetical protein
MQGVDDSTAAVGGVPVINANVPRYEPTKRKRGQRGRDQKSRKVRESPLTAGAKAQALKDKNQGRMVNYYKQAIPAEIPQHGIRQQQQIIEALPAAEETAQDEEEGVFYGGDVDNHEKGEEEGGGGGGGGEGGVGTDEGERVERQEEAGDEAENNVDDDADPEDVRTIPKTAKVNRVMAAIVKQLQKG